MTCACCTGYERARNAGPGFHRHRCKTLFTQPPRGDHAGSARGAAAFGPFRMRTQRLHDDITVPSELDPDGRCSDSEAPEHRPTQSRVRLRVGRRLGHLRDARQETQSTGAVVSSKKVFDPITGLGGPPVTPEKGPPASLSPCPSQYIDATS